MRRYATPMAFKEALKARLRRQARGQARDVDRVRLRLAMERFAARLVREYGDGVVVKGGVVLELRLARARATRDLDLRLVGSPDDTLRRLRSAGRLALGDHLAFEVQPDPRNPVLDAEGMVYEGRRFRVEPRLAGKPWAGPFGVDAAFAEPMHGDVEIIRGSDLLGFVEVEPAALPVYPVSSHIAEKLHAYTLPRTRPNSRVKDLPDLALLAQVGDLRAVDLRAALEATFGHRRSHPLPGRVPDPPATGAPPTRAWRSVMGFRGSTWTTCTPTSRPSWIRCCPVRAAHGPPSVGRGRTRHRPRRARSR